MHPRYGQGVLALVAVVGLSGQLHATERHVPGEYTTIQAGIDAAQVGDTVILADGTYTGTGNTDLHLPGRAMTIRSANGPDACIIDCEQRSRALYIEGAGEANGVIIEGLAFINGTTQDAEEDRSGGAIRCWGGNDLTIRNCRFIGNSAHHGGGAIACVGVQIEDCWFSNNNATRSGGALQCSTGDITRCTFMQNAAGWSGGAMNSNNAVITECLIHGNTAERNGGGVYLEGGDLKYCVILNNRAEEPAEYDGYGGGVCVNSPTGSDVVGCTVTANRAALGGGISVIYGAVEIVGCRIDDNYAMFCGGGVFDGANGTGITNCTICRNTCDIYGGGIHVEGLWTDGIVGCTIADNTAGWYGGGIYYYTAQGAVRNSIVRANDAEFGHNIALDGSAEMEAAYCNVDMSANAVWFTGASYVAWVEGNIDEDALFRDPVVLDYHLLPQSPCVDAGDNTLVPLDVTDIDDDGETLEPLPYDLDDSFRVARGTVDMGAYEIPFGDLNCDRGAEQRGY